MLHCGYSNIRLESYLFTKQAMDDVRKRLKPDGVFVMYNYFRQGWIVSRLQNSVRAAFGDEALVLNLPSRDTLNADDNLGGDFTMFIAGDNTAIRDAFARQPDTGSKRDARLRLERAQRFPWRGRRPPRAQRVAAVPAHHGEWRQTSRRDSPPTTGRCSTCASR